MDKKFLDLDGLHKFKYYLDVYYDAKNKRADNEEVDDEVMSGDGDSSNLVTVKNLAYYHKQLTNNIKTSGSDLNTIVIDAIINELVDDGSESEEYKSRLYESIENIVNERMEWIKGFPEE